MSKSVKNLTLAAMFLAIGQVLPFITMQIPTIGKALCPMHIPVLLCGFICGPAYGAAVGFICPLMRSLLFAFPPMYPNAAGMAFELLAYGLIAGLMAKALGLKSLPRIFISLITAMIGGRIVWGIARVLMLQIRGTEFTFKMFIAGGFTNAIPGIILQLILIPLVLEIYYHRKKKAVTDYVLPEPDEPQDEEDTGTL